MSYCSIEKLVIRITNQHWPQITLPPSLKLSCSLSPLFSPISSSFVLCSLYVNLPLCFWWISLSLQIPATSSCPLCITLHEEPYVYISCFTVNMKYWYQIGSNRQWCPLVDHLKNNQSTDWEGRQERGKAIQGFFTQYSLPSTSTVFSPPLSAQRNSREGVCVSLSNAVINGRLGI